MARTGRERRGGEGGSGDREDGRTRRNKEKEAVGTVSGRGENLSPSARALACLAAPGSGLCVMCLAHPHRSPCLPCWAKGSVYYIAKRNCFTHEVLGVPDW